MESLMSIDHFFQLITKAFDGEADNLDRAEAGQATCEQLIAKAEYELADLKRRFEENRLRN
jgi:hypothetical protein